MVVKYTKAVPGAGKTRKLIDITYELMKEHGIDKVAAITFTERASKELRERIKNKALEEDNETILKNLHIANIGTIHSFCSKIIKDYGYHMGLPPAFDIIEEGEFLLLLRRRIRSYVLESITSEGRRGRDLKRVVDLFDFDLDELIFLLENFMSVSYGILAPYIILDKSGGAAYISTKVNLKFYDDNVKEEILNQTALSFVPYLFPIAEDIIKNIAKFKREYLVMDYDDLQLYALKVIKEYGKNISENIQFILVDEFQDTDRIQIEILRELEKFGSNIMVVGDPNQSIYSFRGAHPFSQNKLIERAEIENMRINYRSSRKLINFYNSVFPSLLKTETMEPSNSDMGSIAICDGDDEDCVISIVSELKSRGINDIAILSRRGTNLVRIKRRLSDAGFDAVITLSPEALDIYSLIYYLYDPSDLGNNLALALSPIFGLSLAEVYDKKGELNSLINMKLGRYRDLLRTEGLSYTLNRMLRELGYIQSLYTSGRYKERVDRFYRIMDLIEQKIRENVDLKDLVEWLKVSWFSKISGPIEDLLTFNKEFIKVMTIHQAKGLEFDAVIIYDMKEADDKEIFVADDEYGIFLRSNNSKYYIKNRMVLQKFMKKLPVTEILQNEEKRILYVAFTRAKKELYLTLPSRLKNDSYSEFLKNIGVTLPIDEDVRKRIENLGIDIIKPVNVSKSLPTVETPNILLIEPNFMKTATPIDLDANFTAILSLAKSKNATIKKLRIYDSGSLLTYLSDGTIISEIIEKDGTIFVENGKFPKLEEKG